MTAPGLGCQETIDEILLLGCAGGGIAAVWMPEFL
ncbi:hypothetical protein ALO81_200372 [Pseudomonas cannabina]|uniref:Type III effector HopAP1 n=1 Tax=Pseudomonas cannabina TaxID=86840 RepID=A0A0P9MJY0_PSECA|nr:hypothetical protein ALO81_200372 [Pseudomonas cannabina]